jgi:hypothetical protein
MGVAFGGVDNDATRLGRDIGGNKVEKQRKRFG